MDRIRTIVKSYTEPNKDVIWFNKKDNKYYYFNNGKWRLFSNNKDIDVTNLSFIKDINVNVLQEEDTVNLVNTYTLENNTTKTLSINIKSENGLSISTKNNDIIIDIKEKQLPNIRWARNGRIDLDNCKNINYILVPCREKCPLLFITNKYLKSFAFRRTISEISDFIINNRATKYNKDTETVKQSLLWKELNQTISDEYLDIEQLPLDLDFVKNNGLYIYTKYLLKEHSCNDEKYGSYIYRKKMNIRTFNRKIPNNYAPIPLLAKYKDKHKIDYILTKLKCFYNYDNDLYQQFERAKETYINFCPYIVIRNTFKKDGGIIPIKDNKLLIDKMLKKIINLEFKVVSNPIYTIHFNDKGILQEPLNPYRYVICTGVGDKHPFRNCNEFKNRYKHFDILRYVYNLYTGEKIIEMFNPKKHNVWNHLYHLYQKRHKIYKLKNLDLYLIGTFYHNDDDKFISGDKFIPYENYKKLPKETGWFLKLGNDINNLTLRCVVPSKMRTIIKQQIRYPKSLINHIINEKYEFSFDRYSDNKDRYPQSNRLNRASHKVYFDISIKGIKVNHREYGNIYNEEYYTIYYRNTFLSRLSNKKLFFIGNIFFKKHYVFRTNYNFHDAYNLNLNDVFRTTKTNTFGFRDYIIRNYLDKYVKFSCCNLGIILPIGGYPHKFFNYLELTDRYFKSRYMLGQGRYKYTNTLCDIQILSSKNLMSVIHEKLFDTDIFNNAEDVVCLMPYAPINKFKWLNWKHIDPNFNYYTFNTKKKFK